MVTPILTSAVTEARETRVNIEAEVKRREAEAAGYGGGGGLGPGGCLRTITTLLCGSRARCRSHYLLANNPEDIAPPGPVVTGVMTMLCVQVPDKSLPHLVCGHGALDWAPRSGGLGGGQIPSEA